MLEFLAVAGLWFWIIITAEIIMLFIAVAKEEGAFAAVSLAIFAAILQWGFKIDIIGYVEHQPLTVLLGLAIYFVIGTIWAILKWKLHVLYRLRRYNELKAEFLERNNIPSELHSQPVPVELRDKWDKEVDNTRGFEGNQIVTIATLPLVSNNKARITRWMSLWVISMFWDLCNDFLREAFATIRRNIASTLQRMANNTWNKSTIEEDLKIKKATVYEQLADNQKWRGKSK